jgi:hypothetical protein
MQLERSRGRVRSDPMVIQSFADPSRDSLPNSTPAPRVAVRLSGDRSAKDLFHAQAPDHDFGEMIIP